VTVWAENLSDFMRSSRVAAITIALFGYAGLRNLLLAAEHIIDWAIPRAFDLLRVNAHARLPAISQSEIVPYFLLNTILLGFTLITVSVAAALWFFRASSQQSQTAGPRAK
jgi:hypothetical protein